MSEDRHFEQTARQWLDQGPTQAPDAAVRAALLMVQTLPQERHVGWRLRIPRLVAPFRLAMAAAIAIVVIVGISQLRSPTTYVGAAPTASPTASPIPTPLDTTGWTTFTSEWYGLSFRHPAGWEAIVATEFWNLEIARNQVTNVKFDSMDILWAPAGNPNLSVFSMRLPPGMSEDAFFARYAPLEERSSKCWPDRTQWPALTVDGHPAVLPAGTCGAWADAIAFVADRVYGFGFTDRAQYPDGPLFRTILSTVKFQPEDAVEPPTPEPSAGPAHSASPVESPAAS